MLDLGFREDLETLLKAAPATRRTVMLSATIPSEIREMARQFQRDALPVDPRTNGAAGTSPQKQAHDDITYVAHLIAAGDRLPATVNLLRAWNAERAIVFCTTREAVGVLHEALLKRGIAAAAISGDRAQAERDRALDLVRRGDARVLVATNVAARGIHLPDVDLIIHADLPLNAESLTHRSGRTGRAGRKGTAVLLATATERRKAERLLSMAHVRANWTPPPSAEAITRAACDRLLEELSVEVDAVATTKNEQVEDALARLQGKVPDATLVRRLMLRELSRLPAGEVLRTPPSAAAFDRGSSRPDADRGPPRAGRGREGVMFRVNLGARDKAEARWLLPLICRRGGITNREVGAIRVGPSETVFEIAPSAAADFAASAGEPDPREPHIRFDRADAGGRPAHAGPPARGPRPSHARPHDAAPRPAAKPSSHQEAPPPPSVPAKVPEAKAAVPHVAPEKPSPAKVAPLPSVSAPVAPEKAPHPKAPREVEIERVPARPPVKAHPRAPRPVEAERVPARPIKAHAKTPHAVPVERVPARPLKPALPRRTDGGGSPFARPARPAHAAPAPAPAPRANDGSSSPFRRPPRPEPAHASPGAASPFARPNAFRKPPFAKPTAHAKPATHAKPAAHGKPAAPHKPSPFAPKRDRH
jgi:ATP-dependent RNA helicase DeaD